MPLEFTVELTQVEEYIDKGQFHEALQVLNNKKNQIDSSSEQKVSFNYLKTICLSMLGQDEEALQIARDIYQTYEETNNFLGMLNSSIIIAESLAWLGKQEKAIDILEKCDNMFKKIPKLQSNTQGSIKAHLFCIKGMVYSRKGEFENAIYYLDRSIALGEQYSNIQDIIQIYYNYGYLLFMRGEIIKALTYYEKALSHSKEGFNRYITRILNAIGVVKQAQGHLDQALVYYEQALEIATKMNCKRDIAGILDNIGELYQAKGNFSQSQRYFNRSLKILEKLDAISVIVNVIFSLFQGTLNLGDFKKAEYYLSYIEEINNREENETINSFYLLSKALILKDNPGIKNIAKAEEILKQIIGKKLTIYEVKREAILNLCDIYLTELKTTSNLEILEEIQPLISQLFFLAKKNYSHSLLAETYLLQARLALIKLEFKEARQLLTQGQKIAENYDLTFLAIKISNEHDELLKELGKWEDNKETKASIEQRINLSHLGEHMNLMLKKQIEKPKEIISEVPVAIFIISEGGVLLFSHSFDEKFKNFKDHLFEGLLTAINAFSDEMFSEGLDRASFGRYTILINSISP
ncbi:MAG: tetratricopeptide repeat protein, partial [Candidatus Hermodarchaeota archaeon]